MIITLLSKPTNDLITGYKIIVLIIIIKVTVIIIIMIEMKIVIIVIIHVTVYHWHDILIDKNIRNSSYSDTVSAPDKRGKQG